MSDTDEEKIWVLQSRDGNPAAFESLIRAHQRMIHSLTFRMTGSMTDAEDLAQETFIRAYRQLDSYQGTAKFSSWLYRIAVNACLNWRQREMRRDQIHTRWAGSNDALRSGPEGPKKGSESDDDQVKELERENLDLKIANQGKDYLIEQLQKERSGFFDQLLAANRKVGELETKLLQLAEPKPPGEI